MTISNETTIITSDNGTLTLTNFRVKYDEKSGEKSRFLSITLDSVSSCGLVTHDKPIFKLLSAISFFVAIFSIAAPSQFFDFIPFLTASGIVFALAYYFSKSAVITIKSNGTDEITTLAKGMSRENILKFVEAVTIEKLKFIGKISNQEKTK